MEPTSCPSLRRELFGSTWSIVAPGRSARPQPQGTGAVSPAKRCPFCEGHEADTMPEVFALRRAGSRPDGPGWTLRVVPNKYPALDSSPFAGVATEPHHELPGRGFHEVVIDAPDHDQPLSAFSLDQLEVSLSVYRSRLEALGKHREVKSFALFRNDGREAGASQEHPHAQILALPMVPPRLQHEIDAANRFLVERGCCLTCGMIESERRDGRRVVASDNHFLAVTSFAPRFPYETWVVPASHSHDFRECSQDGIRSLAAMLKRLLLALESAVGRVPYNLVLQTAPAEMSAAAARAFHWRFELLPRLSAPSGFELGSGVFIVSVTPEDAASRLRIAFAEAVAGNQT